MLNVELEESRQSRKTERFIEVVHCIINYYMHCAGTNHLDSGDEWKRKTGIVKPTVPNDIDQMVKDGFKRKLEIYS